MSESISFVAHWNKLSYELALPGSTTVGQLRETIHQLTGVLPERQKIIFAKKTLKNDGESLVAIGLTDGSKLIIMGSKVLSSLSSWLFPRPRTPLSEQETLEEPEIPLPPNPEPAAEPVPASAPSPSPVPQDTAGVSKTEGEKLKTLSDLVAQVERQAPKLEQFRVLVTPQGGDEQPGDKITAEAQKGVITQHAQLAEALLKLNLKLDSVDCAPAETAARQRRKQGVSRIQEMLKDLDQLLADFTQSHSVL